ncbi:TetR/AcrR family transcriptional regulator [Kribbella speibonae]|uniref:TetR family transcriptional regulator n=1 Tax=Kribbella speibonae TaxID=1572660 RepID=A0A4V2M5R4_9ACTN|nr:TetR family transcriptional regulator C-terminal domain-containing protein [Kribbella speibonae]TCC20922.1 TetR family transcriptional regulator [Kribbella speibonae]TCC40922.1 TetR family transcriptional regulator [Kribbella speibonae]
MTKQVPRGADRQEAIADAAIHLVATRGLRGLTHRAVDTEAGLPPGSTSYYLRTRNALLTACVHRMLTRDVAGMPPPGADPVELMVAMTAGLAQDRPDDLVARYELSLEASRQPELRAAIVDGGRQLRAMLAQLLAGLGVPDPEAAAWPVAAMLDGLMYDRVAGTGTTLSPEAFEAAVRRSVTALIAGLRDGP